MIPEYCDQFHNYSSPDLGQKLHHELTYDYDVLMLPMVTYKSVLGHSMREFNSSLMLSIIIDIHVYGNMVIKG